MAKPDPRPEADEASVFATRLSAGAGTRDVFETELASMDDILGLPAGAAGFEKPPQVNRSLKFQTLKPEPVVLRRDVPAAFATELDGGATQAATRKPSPEPLPAPSEPANRGQHGPSSPRAESSAAPRKQPPRRPHPRVDEVATRLRVGFLAGITLGAGLLLAFSETPLPEPKRARAAERAAQTSGTVATGGALAPATSAARVNTTASAGLASKMQAEVPQAAPNLKAIAVDPGRQGLRAAVEHLRGGRLAAASDAYRALADAAPGDIALGKAAQILERQAAQGSAGGPQGANDSASYQKDKAP